MNECPQLVEAFEQAGLAELAPAYVGDYFPDARPRFPGRTGPTVPEPSRERFAGYAQLDWFDGHRSYLVLWRVDGSLVAPGERAPSLPNGAKGYFREGSSDEDIAHWAIVWADAQVDGCNRTTLVLHSPRLTKQEGKEEILRIAATLTEMP